MSNRWEAILRQIRRHGEAYRAEDDDGVLLGRFASAGDPVAFEALLRRYGSMVYRACRRALPSEQDAEDAFQATFIALVRHAGTIRRQGALAGWLHKTAVRVAWRLKDQSRRRVQREQACARHEAAPATPAGDDVRAVLDEELDRLPEKYRQPVVLCRLLDRPLADAAAELGLSVATIWRRLQYAEELLRDRLTRRGLCVPAGAAIAGCGSAAPAAAVPPAAAGELVRLAVAIRAGQLAGVPTRLLALSGGLYGHRAVVAVAVVLLGVGVGLALVRDPAGPEPVRPVPVQPAPAVARADLPAAGSPSLEITGRVVDAADRAVPGAQVRVFARRWERFGVGVRDELVGRAAAGEDGSFRVAVPPTSAATVLSHTVRVMAADREGKALGVAPAAGGHSIVRVSAGAALSGTVVDAGGVPAAGAAVQVSRFGGVFNDPVGEPLPPDVWPRGAATAADGSFTLAGFDPAVGGRLWVVHPTRGVRAVDVPPGAPSGMTITLSPVRRLSGLVLRADTGAPDPGAQVLVSVVSAADPFPVVRCVAAGADGRFEAAAPTGGRWTVRAVPADAEEYLSVESDVPSSGAGDPVELRLPRAAPVRGQVVDAAGKPAPRAKVWFVPGRPPERAGVRVVSGTRAHRVCGEDGRFALPAPAVEGTLLVAAQDPTFASVELDAGRLEGGAPTGHRVFAHAAVPARGGGEELSVRLYPGVTIECRAVGPDGKAVGDGRAFVRHLVGARDFRVPVSVRGGQFAVHGCQPGRWYAVQVMDAEGKLGAATRLRQPDGPTAGPVTVQLSACEGVEVELTDPLGRPVAGCRAEVTTVLWPADAPAGVPAVGELTSARWWADDPGEPQVTGADGRVAFGRLIPGVSYRAKFTAGDAICYVLIPPEARARPDRLKAVLPVFSTD
ncbi:sigma-70 family RNA polymerase sigma factor [Gemmata sp.]|uniref:sigma-70 family RNA polymerase sigma factor n=1 Tax=Gemmata sp. TaxID=1914242 RepID=UPI003F70A38A